ncbi:MAG: restriction endonuclease [Micavibrio aeruginosavorus]|uniref:Restriction endonuclease n=1 Tax=Micavibrio aeruginosavorus TaxID=349221 RepID=A0A7T5R0U1_9BACT|nr:MAG: restriction endonuclease [Micavibrio aeruginosavorus]
MAVPDYQSLMLPVLRVVAKKEISVPDLVEFISDNLHLSEEDRQQRLPSGQMTTISNRVQWAGTYMVKAGLLERPGRGMLKITSAGVDVLNENPERIDIKYLEKYDSFKDFRVKQKGKDEEVSSVKASNSNIQRTPEDIIGQAYNGFEQSTRDDLLEQILKSSPRFFERLILDVFQAMGYGGRGEIIHFGKSGDGGIDGIINEDPLGLEKIYLQAKRYAHENKINIDQIRSFAGSLDEQGARKGIFVTTSSFVASAYEYAKRSPKSLILIDGEELSKLMYEYDVGVRVVQTIKLKKPDIDYFEEL